VLKVLTHRTTAVQLLRHSLPNRDARFPSLRRQPFACTAQRMAATQHDAAARWLSGERLLMVFNGPLSRRDMNDCLSSLWDVPACRPRHILGGEMSIPDSQTLPHPDPFRYPAEHRSPVTKRINGCLEDGCSCAVVPRNASQMRERTNIR
jgi:hypothetical protein